VLLTRPVLLLPLLPVVWFTWWVGRQYLHVSRELKRLESLKKSPVFVLFSETLQVGCLREHCKLRGRSDTLGVCIVGFGAYVTIVSWGVFDYFASMVMKLQNYTDTAVLCSTR
jgi:hypothetical protein